MQVNGETSDSVVAKLIERLGGSDKVLDPDDLEVIRGVAFTGFEG